MTLVIKFQDRQYLLDGTLEEGGPIATPKQMANFQTSYAYLFSDGIVKRYRKQIGTREDITIIGESDITPGCRSMSGLAVMLANLFDGEEESD
jgi:hypothetical protein